MAVAALDGEHLVEVLAAVQHGASRLEHDGALGLALLLAAAEPAEDELPASKLAACPHTVRGAPPKAAHMGGGARTEAHVECDLAVIRVGHEARPRQVAGLAAGLRCVAGDEALYPVQGSAPTLHVGVWGRSGGERGRGNGAVRRSSSRHRTAQPLWGE